VSVDTVSDDALVVAARAGERAAIQSLLERYQDRIFGFGLRMCGDSEDAKDVLQETLLAAARTVGSFRGDASVSTWLYTIARSFCIKQRRRGKFEPTDEISLDGATFRIATQTPGPDEQAARDETKRAVVAALESLEPAAREIVILRDIEGLTAAEVAQVTGTSESAVKSRLHRARSMLRDRLASTLGDAPTPHAPGCPDVLSALSRQLEGELEPQLCAQMQTHVEGCPACRGRCESLKATLSACAHASPGRVPESVRQSVWTALRDAQAQTITT